MNKKIITIFIIAAMAALSLSVFAGCGEGDKNSDTTTAPATTSVQPTTAKSTLPKTTTAATANNNAESQVNGYSSAGDTDYYHSESENYNAESHASSESSYSNSEADNSSSDVSSNDNSSSDSNQAEVPGDGEIVIHGDPNYVGP